MPTSTQPSTHPREPQVQTEQQGFSILAITNYGNFGNAPALLLKETYYYWLLAIQDSWGDMLVRSATELQFFCAETGKLEMAGQSIRIVLHHKKRNYLISASEPVRGEQ